MEFLLFPKQKSNIIKYIEKKLFFNVLNINEKKNLLLLFKHITKYIGRIFKILISATF